jgi:Holliday junction resolvase RusA-like endonuclease
MESRQKRAPADLMNSLTFFVLGVPIGKTYGFSKGGHQYMKAHVKRWEKTVALAAQAAAGAAFQPYEGFVEESMYFSFPIPESRMCKVVGLHPENCKKIHPGDLHGQDPDTSNLVKSAEDAIKRLLFIDDNRAMLGSCSKHWCAPGNEGVEITVRFL